MSDSPTPKPGWSRNQRAAAALLLCCQPLVIIDATSFNLAIAGIGKAFSLTPDEASTIALGHAVALAVMIPLTGWLGERFGTARVLIGALTVLVIGSVIGFTSDTYSVAVIGRILQAVGGGGLIPLSTALVFRNFDAGSRLRVLGLIALPVSLAPAIGPALGGLVVDGIGWRYVFLLNLPLSLSAIAIAISLANTPTERASRRLDVVGAILTTITLSCLVLGTQLVAGGTSVVVGVLVLAAGLVVGIFLVRSQLRLAGRAFLNVSVLFKHPVFTKTFSIMSLHSAGFLGFGLAVPLLLQTHLGLSAFHAGLLGMTAAVGPVVMSRVAPKIIPKLGSRVSFYIAQGAIVFAIGLTIVGFVTSALPFIIVGYLFVTAGSLMTVMNCQVTGFAAIPGTEIGDATTLDGTGRQVGATLGMNAVAVALALATTLTLASSAVVYLAFGALALFHIAALVVARFVPNEPQQV